MAFFDRLTKTVTEASQKTLAKTKELADTSRLSVMIAEQERLINNQYLQIGKLYVSIHKDNYEEDFSDMFASIADAEAKISDYRKQIQDIKGVQCCDKCGAEVPNGSAFCSSCGAPMPKEPVAEPTDVVTVEPVAEPADYVTVEPAAEPADYVTVEPAAEPADYVTVEQE